MKVHGYSIEGKRALDKLLSGNERFTSGLRLVENYPTLSKLKELAEKGQTPFCIIVSCSDSRAPAEYIFDQGIGDLFIVRVAGNVIAESLLASVEFAATQFKSPLILVMGHTECGAIKASIQAIKTNSKLPSHNLDDLVDRIRPAVKKEMECGHHDSELVHHCTWSNVENTIHEIQKNSQIISQLIQENKLMMMGSVFDIHTGKVELTKESIDVLTSVDEKKTNYNHSKFIGSPSVN